MLHSAHLCWTTAPSYTFPFQGVLVQKGATALHNKCQLCMRKKQCCTQQYLRCTPHTAKVCCQINGQDVRPAAPQFWLSYRCCKGLESPELAKALLSEEGNYQPRYALDIWAFGHFIVSLLGGRKPEGHTAVLTHPDWVEALGKRSRNPKKVPGIEHIWNTLLACRATRTMHIRCVLLLL